MGGVLTWQCFPWGGAHRAGVGEGPGGISLTAGFTLEGDVVGASTVEAARVGWGMSRGWVSRDPLQPAPSLAQGVWGKRQEDGPGRHGGPCSHQTGLGPGTCHLLRRWGGALRSEIRPGFMALGGWSCTMGSFYSPSCLHPRTHLRHLGVSWQAPAP